MTDTEIEKSTNKYKDKIEEKRSDIVSMLVETKILSNHIGDELNDQTNTFVRINDDLNTLDHKLDISEKLVNRFTSWTSWMFKAPQLSTGEKIPTIKTNDDKTIFHKNNCNIKYDKLNLKKKGSELTEQEEKEREGVFYDDVLAILDDLNNDSIVIGKILVEHNVSIDNIGDNIDRSDGRIKKTIEKVKRA